MMTCHSRKGARCGPKTFRLGSKGSRKSTPVVALCSDPKSERRRRPAEMKKKLHGPSALGNPKRQKVVEGKKSLSLEAQAKLKARRYEGKYQPPSPPKQ